MRKAQAQQVFIYLLTIIIIGLMFFFGIKWMGKLWEQHDKINVVQLKVDMETAFNKIRTNYGSQQMHEFRIPGDITKVCFIDQSQYLGKSSKGLCSAGSPDYEPIMCDLWDGIGDENVLFSPAELIESPIYVKDVRIGGDGYICYKVSNNRIKVRLTGLGDSVKVS
jgi:hypothetical protein